MVALPPLNALRSFDAAARHGSVSRAAEDLGVTHGAVSKQLANLESFLGRPVFIRESRGLALTEAGAALFPVVRAALESIEVAIARLRPHGGPEVLTVSVLPSFAAHWLIHRLPRFHERHPGIEVRLSTTRRVVDLAREDVDAALRFGTGAWPGVHAEPFLEETLYPVCAPAFLARHAGARLDAVLRNVIHSHMTDAGNWRRWWAEAGLDPPVPAPAYVYDDTAVAMQAVLRGQGVILGRSPLVADDVAAGRLVRLSAHAVASRERNYLVSLERVRNRPALRAFRDWLLAEAAA